MLSWDRFGYLGYGVSVLFVAMAWALTSAAWGWINPNVSPLFIAAVALAAWFTGPGPSFVAVILASVASTYLVPWWDLSQHFDAGDAVRIATMTGVAVLVNWLNAARKRAQLALQESDRLRRELQAHSVELEQTNVKLQQEIVVRQRAEESNARHQERLRQLAAELALTQERERRQIATQLHDDIGQVLAISQMKLESLASTPDHPAWRQSVEEARQMVQSAIAQTRLITRELSPPVLYEADFERAIEWLADRIQRQQRLEVQVAHHGKPRPLSEEIRVFLFQALRELLMNVVKHARATVANVTIFWQASELRAIVEDNGRGFSAETTAGSDGKGGFGLLNIRERLSYLGGRLESEGVAEYGARVTMVIPTPNQ